MLTDILKQRIEREGPISVADYMQAAAAQYYASRDPFGAAGDFITAPEISQVFGELIGAWLAAQWQAMGGPRCTLLELGPGRGTLMADGLRATRNIPGFHAALDIILLEASPLLEALQREKIQHPRIAWVREPALPAQPLLFIANEFFDALPVRQFVGGQERKIGWNGAEFHFMPGGKITREQCEPAEEIIGQLARHIAAHGGCGLAIDYGYANGERGDTLQAMRNHAFADALQAPGEADLTAHVDFAALARAAGGVRTALATQGDFLRRLGAEPRAQRLCNANPLLGAQILSGVERLLAPTGMGGLFKVMAFTHPSLPVPDGFADQ